jgi:hypothetical protein
VSVNEAEFVNDILKPLGSMNTAQLPRQPLLLSGSAFRLGNSGVNPPPAATGQESSSVSQATGKESSESSSVSSKRAADMPASAAAAQEIVSPRSGRPVVFAQGSDFPFGVSG